VVRIAGEVGLQAAQLHGQWPTRTASLPLYAALQVDVGRFAASPARERRASFSTAPRRDRARASPGLSLPGPAPCMAASCSSPAASRPRTWPAPSPRPGRPEWTWRAASRATTGYKDGERIRAFVRAARGASR